MTTWLFFSWVLIGQLGLPVPAVPALVAAGALVRTGRLSLATAVGLATLASVLGHTFWYEAGRRRGRAILRLVCRVSLEPDLCVRRGENLMGRGAATLILAHFIPGVDLVAQPLAALSGLSRARYLAITVVGALLWALTFTALGYAVGNQLAGLMHAAGRAAAVIVLLIVAAYLGWKLLGRRRLLGELRLARISPHELSRRLADGEVPVIIDLRHPLDVARSAHTIPGALRFAPEELAVRGADIPRDREIVLYCT